MGYVASNYKYNGEKTMWLQWPLAISIRKDTSSGL